MTSEMELFVTVTLGRDWNAKRKLSHFLDDLGYNKEFEFEYLSSNLTDYKKDWPKHVKVPIKSLDGTRIGTLHANLTFNVKHHLRGRYIEEKIENAWIELNWDTILPTESTTVGDEWVDEVRDHYDVDENRLPLSTHSR